MIKDIRVVYPEPLVPGTTYQINEADQVHFVSTYNRALYFAQGENVTDVTVYLTERTKEGWLEHGVLVRYLNNCKMYVGAIQRQPSAPSEFHS